jgi:hypothetical protein
MNLVLPYNGCRSVLYDVAKKGGAEIDRGGGRWHVIKYCRRDAACMFLY